MITKELIERFYDSANAQRWNDHLRPQQGFTELDKQAHKMIIAYVLAKYEEENETQVNWRSLIEGGLFEFLHRSVITDIKPPVYYELRENYGKEIDQWVIGQLEEDLTAVGTEFFDAFKNYILDPNYAATEKKILKGAHYLATNWEFKIVYRMNKDVVFGIEETKIDILSEIEQHGDLIGVQKIALNGKIKDFIDLVGQLRFQKRWAQSPRVPETSVMGHMLIVAIFGYFCAIKLKACDARIVNDYLCGLFHDLPEVLTRDIISPVKRSVAELDEQIKNVERKYIDTKILPLVPESWHEELKYFIQEEFETRIFKDGKRLDLDSYEIPDEYNEEQFRPLDGRILKCCDNLAAFVEAVISCRHGIVSRHLIEGIESISKNITSRKDGVSVVAGIDFKKILDAFNADDILKKNN